MIQGADLKQHPLTFSFDSEVQWQSVVKFLYGDPKASKEFSKLVSKNPMEKTDMMELLDIKSEAQFDAFVLRRDVPKNQKSYFPSDVNPHYFSSFCANPSRYAKKTIILLNEILEKRALPIRAGLDGEDIELRHVSYETSPKKHADLVRFIQREFPDSSTHLHLGLDVRTFKEAEGLAIARALENQLVLMMAREDLSNKDFRLTWRGSPLEKNFTRGSVFFKGSDQGFMKDGVVVAFDVELREYESIEHGLELIAFAAQLAQKRSQLKKYSESFPVNWLNDRRKPLQSLDMSAGNIAGSLQFTARILSESSDKKLIALGKKANDLGDKLRLDRKVNLAVKIGDIPNQPISEPLIIEIQKFLNDNDLVEVLKNPALYLQ